MATVQRQFDLATTATSPADFLRTAKFALAATLEECKFYVETAESKGVFDRAGLSRSLAALEGADDVTLEGVRAALEPIAMTDDEWLRYNRRHCVWHFLKGSACDRDLFEVKVAFDRAYMAIVQTTPRSGCT